MAMSTKVMAAGINLGFFILGGNSKEICNNDAIAKIQPGALKRRMAFGMI